MFRSPETIAARHAARAYLAEAKNRRHMPAFHAMLLLWAANARRRSMPAQRELLK